MLSDSLISERCRNIITYLLTCTSGCETGLVWSDSWLSIMTVLAVHYDRFSLKLLMLQSASMQRRHLTSSTVEIRSYTSTTSRISSLSSSSVCDTLRSVSVLPSSSSVCDTHCVLSLLCQVPRQRVTHTAFCLCCAKFLLSVWHTLRSVSVVLLFLYVIMMSASYHYGQQCDGLLCHLVRYCSHSAIVVLLAYR